MKRKFPSEIIYIYIDLCNIKKKTSKNKCYDCTSRTDDEESIMVFFSLSLLRWRFLLFELECRCFLWCFLCFFPFLLLSSCAFPEDSSTTVSIFDESVVGIEGVVVAVVGVVVGAGEDCDSGCCSFFDDDEVVLRSSVPRERLLDRRRSRLDEKYGW